jgi:hypothetical protein
MRASCNWGIRVSNVWNEVSDVHVSCADVAVRVLLFPALQITLFFGINENVIEMYKYKKGCRLPMSRQRTSIQSIKKGYSRIGIDSLISLDTMLPIGHKKALLLKINIISFGEDGANIAIKSETCIIMAGNFKY